VTLGSAEALWTLGFNVRNIGTKISFDGGANSAFIPTNLGLGTGLLYPIDETNAVSLNIEANKLLVPTPPLAGNVQKVKDYNSTSSIGGIFKSFGDATGGFKEELREVRLSLGAEYNHNDKFFVRAGYSYLSPKIKTASTTRDDGIFLLMPRHSANLWTTYDIGNATIGGGVNAMSGIKSSQGVRGGGYATFDLMASYRITPQLNLQVNVDNLFDRKYYTRVGSTNTFNIPGAERSIMATLRYDFK